MFAGNDQARIDQVTAAFLRMKKFDVAKLQELMKQHELS